jgi:N-acetylglucosaminyl-diphospho-decaprenol L-rhamnosyltransferase
MLLSVIIVNYNVKYFLEQCLYSVEKAIRGIGREGGIPEAEVIVVDNHSADDSIEYLRPKFPQMQFIVNEENVGFSRANNQALERAGGKYILFLNPDTVIPEDSLAICISFMLSTPGAGALGVRMVDGSGRFLKESRRGFPSPWVAFCKLAGLTSLFPHSKLLAKYHLGHLPERETHPAPILSGAFLLAGKEVLDRTGGFDERFFMYAEDIDLSYRIEQAGYTNYYLAETTILHFKGESTRKDARYVKIFYTAMSQFRRKHFNGVLPGLFNGGVEAGIWLRAGITAAVQLSRGKGGPSGGRPSHGVRGNTAGVCRTRVTGDGKTAEKLMGTIRGGALCDGTIRDGVPDHGTIRDGSVCDAVERTLVEDESQADEIIFCEGDTFSFRDIIEALQRVGSLRPCKIHAAASTSFVGSHSKDGMGDAVVIKVEGV